MKRILTFAAAIGLAVTAQAQTPTQNQDAQLIHVPSTSKTEVYDGPNSPGMPGQPAPGDGYSAPEVSNGNYPFCSETVRDNCRQRRDPSY